MKREIHYIFDAAISKHSHEIWWSLVEFWNVSYSPVCLMLKSHSTRINFFKFLELKLSPQKSLRCIPILVATCNICKNRLAHRRYLSGYYEKYHVQSTSLWSSILVKTTLSLELLWAESGKCRLPKMFWWRRSIRFGNFKKISWVWVYFYSKFAGFFSKAAYYWFLKIRWKHHWGLG